MTSSNAHLEALNDPSRLDALYATGLLDSARQEAFDRLTRLARSVLDADVSVISLVEPHRQFTLSDNRTDGELAATRESPISHSYCQYVVSSDQPLVVSDAREHPLLRDNPAVVEYNAIAYAGMPLRTAAGYTLGSFCALANRPRDWSEQDVRVLEDLAAAAATEIELRLDVMLRRRVEEQLSAAIKAAEAANAAKSEFLASMSHELRTPLNSVIGFTNVLMKNRSGRLEAGELQYLERIRANGMHLLGLIDEVLDLAKVEAGHIEVRMAPVDLRQLVERTAEELDGRRQSSDVSLQTDLPDRLNPLLADELRLKQVLINLAGNALKFTERGHVRIVVRADSEGRPLCLEVQDTGIGIQQERVAAVFEPFAQADRDTHVQYGGTGLGLTISRALAGLMGFRLEAESEPGTGSTFRVHFEGHDNDGA